MHPLAVEVFRFRLSLIPIARLGALTSFIFVWTGLTTPGKSSEPINSTTELLQVMDAVTKLSKVTVPAAKSEFPVLEAKFSGQQYNFLVASLRSPIAKADLQIEEFAADVKQGEKSRASTLVLVIVDNLRALDGILLAEALAGSNRSEELLKLYLQEESALTQLSSACARWVNNIEISK